LKREAWLFVELDAVLSTVISCIMRVGTAIPEHTLALLKIKARFVLRNKSPAAMLINGWWLPVV